MQCPSCGSYSPFFITVTTTMLFGDSGCHDDSDEKIWKDSSACKCSDCGHTGTVKDFDEVKDGATLYQLADDADGAETYGEKAGWWLIVTEDQENELTQAYETPKLAWSAWNEAKAEFKEG